MVRLVAVLVLFACGIVAMPVAQAGEEFTERVFPLRGHGAFTVWTPESWLQDFTQPKGDVPPTIVFLPAAGQEFEVMITPVRPANDAPAGYNSSRAIRAMVEDSAGAVQKTAVEERLAIVPIAEATGFYFSATDPALVGRTPPPGEYRHLAQGILAVDDLLCIFTILSNDPDIPLHVALSALSTAAHRGGS